jgi:tight adherence protein B
LDRLSLILILVFGSVLLGFQALYWLVYRARSAQKSVNRRLAETQKPANPNPNTVLETLRQKRSVNRRLTLTDKLANPTVVLEALRRERGLVHIAHSASPLVNRINLFLIQTGVRIDPGLFIIVLLVLTGLFFALLGRQLDYDIIALLIAFALAGTMMGLWLWRARRRRIARFAEQLPDALDVIVRGVRVGHPLSTALTLVAKEMPDPIGTEFGMTSDEISFGLDVRRAIENLYRRVGQEDLLFFVVAINVQSQTGGNIGEVVARLSHLIRQRFKVRAKIRSLSAEGRLSGIFMSLIPFILFGLVSLFAPNYFGIARGHPATIPVLIFGLSVLALGNITIYRMVNFKI